MAIVSDTQMHRPMVDVLPSGSQSTRNAVTDVNELQVNVAENCVGGCLEFNPELLTYCALNFARKLLAISSVCLPKSPGGRRLSLPSKIFSRLVAECAAKQQTI